MELQTAKPREVGVQGHARAVKMEAARALRTAREAPGGEPRGVSEAEARASVRSQAGTGRRQATEVPRETEPRERLLSNDETPQGFHHLLHPLGDRGTSVLARGGATTAGETTVEERDATTLRAEVEATINVETMALVEVRTAPAARAGIATGEVRALGAEASSRLSGAGGSGEARTEDEEVGEF